MTRTDARNRLSLDFDMLRIQAVKDLQTGGTSPRVTVERIEGTNRWRPMVDGKFVRTPKTGVARNFPSEAAALKAGLQAAAAQVTPPIGPALDKIAADVSMVNARGVTAITGINVREASGLGARLDVFRETNISLIKSLVGNQITDVQNLLESAESTGLRVEDLAEQMEQRFSVSKSKADLLARDQTLKLNANITQARQRGAGVEKYIWTTSGDERVREEHQALEGQVFSWDDPPSVGHPGEDYQCRCTAFPIIEEFDDEVGMDLGLVSPGGAVNSFDDD